MKTLELKLKKKVLIVDLPIDSKNVYMSGNSIIYNTDKSCIAKPINDEYEFLCKGSELTEEIASELVEMEYSVLYKKSFFIDYDRPSLLLKFAKESFISAVESKEKFWLENPIEKPINYDLWYKYGDYTQYGKKLTKECLKWQEAGEKTFKNPLIFVKK